MLLQLFNLLLWPAGLSLVIYFALYITGWFSGGVCTSKRRLDGKFVVITGTHLISILSIAHYENNESFLCSANPTTESANSCLSVKSD